MDEVFTKAEELAAHVKEYVNNRIASVKLSIAEKSSAIIANIVARVLVLTGFMFFVLLASIAFAFLLSQLTGEYYWGFLIVAVLHLLVGLLVWIKRDKIIRLPIMNSILQQLFKEDVTEDEED